MFRSIVRDQITGISRFGERHGIDALTYNPLVMRRYDRFMRADAPAMSRALTHIFPDAGSLLDVGAGTGALAAEIQRQGRAILTCERSRVGRLRARQRGVRCRPFDLARTPPAQLEGGFDLSLCIEVAEHVPPEHADTLVEFLADTAPIVVFTAARPGQGGHGHVNEQPREYWMSRFAYNRKRHSPMLSGALSAAFSHEGVQAPWLLENLMVFESNYS